MMNEKKALRKQILSVRNGMPPALREEKSCIIIQTLTDMELYRKAETLLAYVDYQSEVITTHLIQQALQEGKQVFVPKVLGDEMEFYRITNMGSLAEGYKGIREPAGGQLFSMIASRLQGKAANIPLMLMPGAVFDEAGHRIGYGKGFYDRYLKRLMEKDIPVHTLALCFACQMLAKIPYEEHDIRAEMVLTEEGLYP